METMSRRLAVALLGIVLLGITNYGEGFCKDGYTIKGFVGNSPTEAAPNTDIQLLDGKSGTILNSATTNFFGKYSFSGLKSGEYILKVGKMQKKVTVGGENVRMDIDLSARGGTMDYAKPFVKKLQKPAIPASTKSKIHQAAPTATNPSLAAQIAGVWWGYANSTERKIGLCPDGSYMDYTESGYSGRSFDSGGNETMAWGTASQRGGSGKWSIQGNDQQGTIYVTYNNGNQTTLSYRQCGEPGCLIINGNKLCRTGEPCK